MTLQEYLGNEGVVRGKLVPQMQAIVKEVFSHLIGKFKRLPRGHITFELLGLDFMVDDIMQVSARICGAC